MNTLMVTAARWFDAACALAVLYAVVAVYMAVTDRRSRDAEREHKRERDYWRTTKADPRRSQRSTRRHNWRPPNGGFAA